MAPFVGVLGFVAFIVGVVSLIWPLRFLKIHTRLQGLGLAVVGCAALVGAMASGEGAPSKPAQTTAASVPASGPSQEKSGSSPSQGASPSTAPAKPAEKPADPPKPKYNFTLTVNGTNYKGKVASEVGVAVLNVSSPKRVGNEYVNRAPEGKFVQLELGVSNHQKDAITVDSNLFKVIANGKEYSSSVEASTALEMSGQKTFFLKQLNPDMSTVGYLIFDLPPNLDLASAELQFRGGMTGKTERLPIKPISE